MYCIYGNSSWYIDCCPLYGRCPLLGVSVIGGSTVVHFTSQPEFNFILLHHGSLSCVIIMDFSSGWCNR